ncbi:MAG TPA: TonB family protein [Thermoanaerobaculia bacterium]|nr:TonB family protein [Thermoanaerobaculia bacterium]
MPSILVVEQDERYVERIRAALSSEGWAVRVVPRADQAIQVAASEAPDLVIVSAEVPAAGTLAGAFSRNGGGPGAVGLLPEGATFAPPGFAPDDLLAKPFTDESLLAAARRTLASRGPAAAQPPSPPAAAAVRPETKLTSHDIFGDVLAEVEGPVSRPAPAVPAAPAGPPPLPPAPAAKPAAPSAPAAAAPDDEMKRRLEKTLSGMLGPDPKPRPAAPPAAPSPPPRRSEPAAGDVDALLSKTLSNLDLGKTKTGVRPPPPAAPAPPSPPPLPPAPRPAAAAPPPPPAAPPPAAAAPVPPPARPAAAPPPPVSEGTAVRKARTTGEFDFSELEELARSGRAPAAPPRPAGPPPPPRAAAPPPPTPPVARPAPPAAAEPLPFQAPPAPEPVPPPRPAVPFAQSVGVDAAATQRLPVFTSFPEQPVEGERFGQYTLLERIAAGGMAEVWKARMQGVEGFQKTVAIKRILPHMTDNAEFIGMFIDEAKLAAQLSHPNIVHIYDLGKIGRDYYIAMEYVEGKDLRSLLNAGRRRGLPLPLGLSLMVASRVASALDYAHRKRDFEGRELALVHRDVSPQNVLLTYDGDVKLCDFGIAKAVSKASQTLMGALKGKLQYMSPEQAWGRPVDGRSDLFSLGSVLFEMVTGERLFPGESEISVLESVRQGQVRSPRQVNPAVPKEVDEIVTRALAVDPQARFQTAGEMKQRLEAVLAALPAAGATGPADLAAYIHRLLNREEAPPAESAPPPSPPPPASWPPAPAPAEPAAPAPPMAAIAGSPFEAEAPVEPVAPVGDLVAVGEEGGRKGRTLLWVAIALLAVVAVVTFFFLNRRRGEAPPAQPAPAVQAPGATPGAPLPAASPTQAGTPAATGTPGGGVNVQAIVNQQLAQKEEEYKKKLEQQQKDIEKQLAAAKATGKPLPPGATPQPSPAALAAPPAAPTPAVKPPTPEPPPPTPEPKHEAEPEKPPAPEPVKPRQPEPAPAPRAHVGDLVELGPGVTAPQLVTFPKPEYPPLARTLRVEGVVVILVLVDENGQVQDAKVAEGVKQNVGLNEAALKAARTARYQPATKDGVRVKMWTRLRIPFKM